MAGSEMVWKQLSGNSIINICDRVIRVVKQVLLSVGIISSIFLLLNPAPKISHTFSLLCGSIPSFCVWFRSWLSPSPPSINYPFVTVIFILVLILVIVDLASSSSSSSSSSSPTSSFLEEFTLMDYSSAEEVWSSESELMVSGGEEEETAEKTSSVVINNYDSGGRSGETAGKLESTAGQENESIEKTWKAIMEEHGIPAARQLKKCGTWDVPVSHCGDGRSMTRARREDMMKKSNTFAEARSSFRDVASTTTTTTNPYPMRKHEFLSQDELNRRVEDFISKCRNKMRLERLESDQRFMDILNRSL